MKKFVFIFAGFFLLLQVGFAGEYLSYASDLSSEKTIVMLTIYAPDEGEEPHPILHSAFSRFGYFGFAMNSDREFSFADAKQIYIHVLSGDKCYTYTKEDSEDADIMMIYDPDVAMLILEAFTVRGKEVTLVLNWDGECYYYILSRFVSMFTLGDSHEI